MSVFGPRVKLENDRMTPKPSSMPPLIFNIVNVLEDVYKYLHGLNSSEMGSPKSHAALLCSHLSPFPLLLLLSKVIKEEELGVREP